jgi:hypothetical protein
VVDFILKKVGLIIFFLTIILTLSVVSSVNAATATLTPPTQDTFLDTYNPNQNYGSSPTINVEGGSTLGVKQRALLKFDLSAIPSGTIITKATLRLYASGYWSPIIDQTLTVYRVTEDWNEGDDTDGATWNEAFHDASDHPGSCTPWTGTIPSGSGGTWTTTGSVTQAAVSSGWISWEVTDIVKAWIESGEDNFGFIVKLADESGTNYWQQFASSTYYDIESRPVLEIDYPHYDIEQNGVTVNSLDIPVGSTFSVDIWIRNIPGNGLDSFYFVIKWDPNMMVLESHQNASNPGWDDWGPEVIEVDVIDFYGISFGGGYITDDMSYLTLTFRCLNQGSSQIMITDGSLGIEGEENNILPPDFYLTCNQYRQQPPPNPVGGIYATNSKLTLLGPYITLVSLIGAVSTIFAIRRWCKD